MSADLGGNVFHEHAPSADGENLADKLRLGGAVIADRTLKKFALFVVIVHRYRNTEVKALQMLTVKSSTWNLHPLQARWVVE